MAQDLRKLYERSKIGSTISLAFSDAASTRLELADDAQAQQNKLAPRIFLLRVTNDVHLRQGNNAVAAATTDFLLFSDSYYQLLVEDARDNHLAAIGPTDKSGIVFVTEVSSV